MVKFQTHVNVLTHTQATYIRQGDGERLSFVMAPDVTLQTVLAAERLLTAVAGAVEGLLSWRRRVEGYISLRLNSAFQRLIWIKT